MGMVQHTKEFPRIEIPETIKTTSWKDPFFGLFIYNTIRYLRPEQCVELGTYAGYSAYCIGRALLDNCRGVLDCYDLWEDYPYNHVSKKDALLNLQTLPIKLNQEDALKAHSHYSDGSVDVVMVDLSNDGDTYKKTLEDWHPKLKSRGVVMLEGGSEERDKVEWMIKFNKKPIQSVLTCGAIADGYFLTNIGGFPSLTIAKRKT